MEPNPVDTAGMTTTNANAARQDRLHRMTNGRIRVVIYCRLSKDDSNSFAGVERQEKVARALVAKHPNWDIVVVLVDNDASAADEDISKRPDYVRLLEMIKNEEFDLLVSYHVDRISRNRVVIAQFLSLAEKHPILFQPSQSYTVYDLGTADGQDAFSAMGSAAVHENKRKSERVKLRIEDQVTEGMLHGGARPYGFHRAPKTGPKPCPTCGELMEGDINDEGAFRAAVAPCPKEQDRLQWFADQLLLGKTYYQMAAHANAKGWSTATVPNVRIRRWSEENGYGKLGKRETIPQATMDAWRAAGEVGEWYPGTVAKVLNKSANFGLRDEFPTPMGAILSDETHTALQLLQAVPKKAGRQVMPSLLGRLGILKCGRCGENLQACGAPGKSKNGTPQKVRYGCIKAPGYRSNACGALGIIREGCEEQVVKTLVGFLGLWRQAGADDSSDIHQAEEELAQAERELDKLQYNYLDLLPIEDRLTDEEYRPRNTKLRQKIRTLTDKLAHAALNSADEIPQTGHAEWWKTINQDRQRKILKATIKRIEIAPAVPGKPFDKSRVKVDFSDSMVAVVDAYLKSLHAA